MLLHSSSGCRSARSIDLDQRKLVNPLLGVLAILGLLMTGNSTVQAQCPAPWFGAAIYGTMIFQTNATTSDGLGGTANTIENDLVSFKMANPVPCAWSTANFGAMGGLLILNDTDLNPLPPQCLDRSYIGSGPPVGPEQYVSMEQPGTFPNWYLSVPNASANVILTQKGTCGGGTSSIPTTVGWGPNLALGPGVVVPPLTSAPVLGETTVVSGVPNWNVLAPPIDWTVTWQISVTPEDDCKPCKDSRGSDLSLQNQSLGENISIVGTPFYLHYESSRSLGHAGTDVVAAVDARSLGGWTFNVHHALEPQVLAWCIGGGCTPNALVPKALFLGDGSTRDDSDVQSPVSLNGNVYITSEDGADVYVFKNYVHVQTLRPMTGAVLYSFGYDGSGQLISITDNAGNVTKVERAANESPTAIVSPYDQVTLLSVDANGYLNQITDPAGRVIKLSNGLTGLLTSLTDPNGHTFNFKYDPYGRLINDSDPAGGSLTLTRTDTTSGYSVSEKTALGVTSKYALTFSSVPGTSTTQQFTNTWPNGLKATNTDTQGLGKLSSTTMLPDGTSYSSTSSPDPRWGIQVPIDAKSNITLGNLTMNTTSTRTATLGTAGNPFSLITQTDTNTINGRNYTSVFTSSNRAYVDTSPVGRKATTVLDSLERVSSVQLGILLPAQVSYDARGRLSTILQGTRKTTFIYDSDGFLASVTDPLGLTNSFTYDADGHILTKTLADGRVITFTYDPNGNLISLTPPGKMSHTFAYNTVNLPSTYTPPQVTGTGATTYAYDKDRNLTTITRPDTKTIIFKYDTAGRLSSAVAPTETVNYAYSASTGNLASASIPAGESIAYGYNGPLPISSTWSGTVAGSVSRSFNNNFWVTLLSLDSGNTVNFSYDNDGLVTKAGAMTITHDPSDGLITGTTLGSVTDTRTYNSFGELTGYAAKHNTATLYSVIYTRDADGRIGSKTETINGRTTTYAYTYDKAGRLTSVKQNGTTTSTYTYDTNSNRLKATTPSGTVNSTYDAQDRLLTYGTSSFTYTANGELASQKTGTQTTTYQYDVLGNLITETLPDTTKVKYLIDPENHRVARQVNGQQTGYLYDGDRIVAQLNGSNQVVSQFVYATGANSPDYLVHGGATYRIISDQLGSPRLVVNAATGAVDEQMNYDEFGNVLLDSNAGFQPFGFAGGLKDPYTGFVRFGARDYNPVVGRWTAKDPIRFAGGDTDLYGYVLDDPINLVDPGGLDSAVLNFLTDRTSQAFAQNYQSDPGILTVVVHGSNTPGKIYIDNKTEVKIEDLANKIVDKNARDDLLHGQRYKIVHLIVCHGNKGKPSVKQQLQNLLGPNFIVQGSDEQLRVWSDGHVTTETGGRVQWR